MRYFLAISVVLYACSMIPGAAAEEAGVGAVDEIDWNAGNIDIDGTTTTIDSKVEKHRIDKRGKPGRKLMRKDEAAEYIGDLRTRLLEQHYDADLLVRKRKDIKTKRITDGIVFNTGGGVFGYLERTDGAYKLLLDTTGGRQYRRVTEDNVFKFINSIRDDKLMPYVIFDKEGNEAAILYLPWGTLLKQKFSKSGNVYLEFKTR